MKLTAERAKLPGSLVLKYENGDMACSAIFVMLYLTGGMTIAEQTNRRSELIEAVRERVNAAPLPTASDGALRATPEQFVRQVVDALLSDWREQKKGSLPQEYEYGYEAALEHVVYRAGKIAPPPAQDPVPALGLPAGEVEALRAQIAQLEKDNFALAANQCDGPMIGDEYGHFRCAHVLAPPASAADGEGLLVRREGWRVDAFRQCWERGPEPTYDEAEDEWVEHTARVYPGDNGFMVSVFGSWVDGVWPTFEEAADVALREGGLADTTPPPAPPSRVAGLDREAVCRVIWDTHFRQDHANRPHWEKAVRISERPGNSLTADRVGKTREIADAILALASLRSTQADTGGESQTPAPAGDAVEALKPFAEKADRIEREYAIRGREGKELGDPLLVSVALGDLRRARAALAAIAQGLGAGQAEPNHSKDFQLMMMRIIQRHRNGRDLTETLKGAEDLLKRKGSLSVFRGAPLPADPATAASEEAK